MSECPHGIPRMYRCGCDCPHPHPVNPCPHEHICDIDPGVYTDTDGKRVVRMDALDSREREIILALIAADRHAKQLEDPEWQKAQLNAGKQTLKNVRRELRGPRASRSQSAVSRQVPTSRT